jgi:hypothetical protein
MAEASPFVGTDNSLYNRLQGPVAPANPMQQMGQMVQLQNGMLANQAGHFELAQKQIGAMRDTLSSLMADPELSINKVTQATTGLVANGLLDPKIASQELAGMPQDADGIRMKLKQYLYNNLAAQSRLEAVYGSVQNRGYGAGTVSEAVSPSQGFVKPLAGGNLPMQTTPGEKMAGNGSVVAGPNGEIISVDIPNSVRFDPYGNPLGTPVASPAGAPAATSMAPRGMRPAAPVPAAPVAPQAAPGVLATGAPVGAAGAADIAAKQSADQGGQLQALADAAPQRKAQLNQLEQLLGQTNTGPIAGALSTAGALANQVLGTAGSSLRVPGVADKEEFQKVASQLQAAQGQALGGTDAAKVLAGHANPSLSFSTEGNRHIVQMLKGQEDAISAKNSAWQEWKKSHGADTYGAFQEDFNKHYEPRAFMAPYMSRAERDKMRASMSPNELAAVKTATQHAIDRGWINPPKD